eukprot:4205562-Pleurochrysis_carterae.AAC.1
MDRTTERRAHISLGHTHTVKASAAATPRRAMHARARRTGKATRALKPGGTDSRLRPQAAAMREGIPSAAVATSVTAGVSKIARAEKRGRWGMERNERNR